MIEGTSTDAITFVFWSYLFSRCHGRTRGQRLAQAKGILCEVAAGRVSVIRDGLEDTETELLLLTGAKDDAAVDSCLKSERELGDDVWDAIAELEQQLAERYLAALAAELESV